MIDEDTLIDLMMFSVDVEQAFGPHRDTGNHKSSSESLTAHVNTWVSDDYFPDNNNCKSWTKSVDSKTIRHEAGSISGRFGEMECALDEYIYKFSFEKNFLNEIK